jgi:hypothetical protein
MLTPPSFQASVTVDCTANKQRPTYYTTNKRSLDVPPQDDRRELANRHAIRVCMIYIYIYMGYAAE